MTGTDWSGRGLCRTADPDDLFVEGAAQNRAKALCDGCSVRTECLAYALDERIEHGVWGGATERERRALLRRRPTVASWRRLLDTARAEHESVPSRHPAGELTSRTPPAPPMRSPFCRALAADAR
ncbi:WhiB family transcriptional regulator [Streptomyces phaeochromogenes]|uniref:WhiB family transcriptional regulator n=1 Tax=Streptomyces phaeochromogenes TaxID=1923 RepID=UPI00386BB2AC|nr:WhiB family transcriptional regulator [Streptomyces phaeochromogenes]